MKQYIGSKIVQAEPAWRITDPAGRRYIEEKRANGCCENGSTIEDGYKVIYRDGYESWSPKEVFEEAYRQTDGMSFGLALEACKMGKRIARKGWNGKGQYVELGRSFTYFTDGKQMHDTYHEDIGSQALVFVGTRGRQVGWLASQSDMLADDWRIIERIEAMGWDDALEAVKAGAAVHRKGWDDASWVGILDEPAELKGKTCKVCLDTGDIVPDWEPEGEDLEARDWHIVEA